MIVIWFYSVVLSIVPSLSLFLISLGVNKGDFNPLFLIF